MTLHLQMGPNGRIVIPKQIRNSLGIKEGSTIVANIVNNTLELSSLRNSINKARNLVKQYCTNTGKTLVEDLLTFRKEDFQKECKEINLDNNDNC